MNVPETKVTASSTPRIAETVLLRLRRTSEAARGRMPRKSPHLCHPQMRFSYKRVGAGFGVFRTTGGDDRGRPAIAARPGGQHRTPGPGTWREGPQSDLLSP